MIIISIIIIITIIIIGFRFNEFKNLLQRISESVITD